jgi:ribonuclease HI
MSMQNFQIQLPTELLERLNAFAALRGRTPEELVKAWIQEKVPTPRGDLFASALDSSAPAAPRPEPILSPAAAPPSRPFDGTWRLWADGACSGNPGPGGWGIVVQGPEGEETDSQGYRNTTNNRMEMRGAIAALSRVPRGDQAILHTDSRYVVDAITKKWVEGWRKRGWRKADGGEVKNVDLWEEMVEAMEGKRVRFQWVEGHAGDRNNERCDRLAVAATKGDRLEPDRHG